MKGYYQLFIRRAATGAKRTLNFHNHLLPGFYDILMNKSVTDNKNSVIDLLFLGNGVGSHPDTAISFNGETVFEKKYINYVPPNNFDPAKKETEFHHVFEFSAIIEEQIRVGEVGVGARVNDEIKFASMVHLQNVDGEPTEIVLLPGDEINIVWNLVIAKPVYIPQPGVEDTSYSISNLASSEQSLDYEMFAAYPNWHLMGINRIAQLIFDRNQILTNTPWTWLVYSAAEGKRIPFTPTYAEINAGVQFGTDSTITGFKNTKSLFVPHLLGPLKIVSTSDPDDNRYWMPKLIDYRLAISDLYTSWLESYNTSHSQVQAPKIVPHLNVAIKMDYDVEIVPSIGRVIIDTIPFILVTVYADNQVVGNGVTDEFGRSVISSTDITVGKTVIVRAHVKGHQVTRQFVIQQETTEHSPLLSFLQYGITGSAEYPASTPFARFKALASRIGARYKVTLTSKVISGSNVVPAIREGITEVGDISRLFSVVGPTGAGDEITLTLRDATTNVLLETLTHVSTGDPVASLPIPSETALHDMVSIKFTVKDIETE